MADGQLWLIDVYEPNPIEGVDAWRAYVVELEDLLAEPGTRAYAEERLPEARRMLSEVERRDAGATGSP